MNLSRRVKHIELRLGITGPRYILTITCSDKTQTLDPDRFGCTEILPGFYSFAWGEPLTSDEIEQLREKYLSRQFERND